MLGCEDAQDKNISALVGWSAGDKVQGSGSQSWRGVGQLHVHKKSPGSRLYTMLASLPKFQPAAWPRC